MEKCSGHVHCCWYPYTNTPEADFVRMAKSRRIRWLGQVAHMGKKRNSYTFFDRKPEAKRLGIDGRIISKWILWHPVTGLGSVQRYGFCE
jgi:hypothetical protein